MESSLRALGVPLDRKGGGGAGGRWLKTDLENALERTLGGKVTGDDLLDAEHLVDAVAARNQLEKELAGDGITEELKSKVVALVGETLGPSPTLAELDEVIKERVAAWKDKRSDADAGGKCNPNSASPVRPLHQAAPGPLHQAASWNPNMQTTVKGEDQEDVGHVEAPTAQTGADAPSAGFHLTATGRCFVFELKPAEAKAPEAKGEDKAAKAKTAKAKAAKAKAKTNKVDAAKGALPAVFRITATGRCLVFDLKSAEAKAPKAKGEDKVAKAKAAADNAAAEAKAAAAEAQAKAAKAKAKAEAIAQRPEPTSEAAALKAADPSSLYVKELKELLEDNGLPTSGIKQALIDRANDFLTGDGGGRNWVQCDEPGCQKWRWLPDSTDMNKIKALERWTCSMNNDRSFNSCDKPDQSKAEVIEQRSAGDLCPVKVERGERDGRLTVLSWNIHCTDRAKHQLKALLKFVNDAHTWSGMGEGVPDVFCLQECTTKTKRRLVPLLKNAGFAAFDGIYAPSGTGTQGSMMYNLVLVRHGTFDHDHVGVSAESNETIGPMVATKPFKYPPVVVSGRIRGKDVTIVTHHTPGSDKTQITRCVGCEGCEASATEKIQRRRRQAERASVGEEQGQRRLPHPCREIGLVLGKAEKKEGGRETRGAKQLGAHRWVEGTDVCIAIGDFNWQETSENLRQAPSDFVDFMPDRPTTTAECKPSKADSAHVYGGKEHLRYPQLQVVEMPLDVNDKTKRTAWQSDHFPIVFSTRWKE